MVPEPNDHEPFGPEGPVPDFEEALSDLTNAPLLSALDLALLELEKRFYRYAHLGPELLEMVGGWRPTSTVPTWDTDPRVGKGGGVKRASAAVQEGHRRRS